MEEKWQSRKGLGAIADLAPKSLEAMSPRNRAGTEQAVPTTELGMV